MTSPSGHPVSWSGFHHLGRHRPRVGHRLVEQGSLPRGRSRPHAREPRTSITASVDAAGFKAAQAKADLREDGWLAKALRAHDRVVQDIFAQVPVLPLRFGALCASRSGVIELLNVERARFCGALELIRDAAEWSVRVIPKRQSEVDDRQPLEPMDGTSWMLRRREAAVSREEAHQRWLRVTSEVHTALATHAVRADGRVPAVYLVRRGDESAFARTALAFSQRLAGTHLELKVDGPQPAYHFVEAGGCRD